ncbi:CopG family transcriptional regulator [Nesterenkonia sp. MY13]|uniref:CopG family transcriptional regulator n=1 Tax=Nesterenkonia sedimenti TaxID=1463632 RepID=A0A7X8TLQ6_9MICC|nr:CopG family antitoxin [Nesterenkonia sedimenti]NLS10712.1 CopG family transcriptional regulator [Nesterenkonia sedimenti]
MSKQSAVEEFDRKFDAGEDISDYVDWSTARRVDPEPKRVNVDFPQWMVDSLDNEAKRLGVTRQSVIKVWIADRLEERRRSAA